MARQGEHLPAKRRKLNSPNEEVATTAPQSNAHKGLDRPISPPLSRRRSPERTATSETTWSLDDVPKQTLAARPAASAKAGEQPKQERDNTAESRTITSPVQLTRIAGLGAHHNIDAVGLGDLLGDPLIKECWNFNFLFDIDFVMKHFDSDVRNLVKVKIIHGFWKRDDPNRIALLEKAEQYPNVELLHAYIPDPFGTHHSKMLILYRHDDTAQVIIHTANMIDRDWTNMTQAVWASPHLPLLSRAPSYQSDTTEVHPIGSGERFKVDLLRYLGTYEKRLKSLTTQLNNCDFSSVKAAFIGSAPSRQKPAAASPSKATSFGWLGLQEILSRVPIAKVKDDNSSPHIITQISSIATLGAQPTWLSHFQSVLACYATTTAAVSDKTPALFSKASTFFAKCEPSMAKKKSPPPKYSVVFPTAEEIRTSLDGYTSGHSIHWKLQSAQQQKQLEYMHPLLCHWTHSSTTSSQGDVSKQEAHRGPAAPHIKTYIRFANGEHRMIDWAMVTSANLSKQAWGDVVNKKDEIWIQSWETGVVVWPALFAEPTQDVVIVPVFGKDMPGPEDQESMRAEESAEAEVKEKGEKTVVGFRMPYDLPLVPYTAEERPWCATMQYLAPDIYGHAWAGYGR